MLLLLLVTVALGYVGYVYFTKTEGEHTAARVWIALGVAATSATEWATGAISEAVKYFTAG